ncbi:hypothetical protein FS935_18495 [Metabacillus litoralis]|uniref:Uncharacterized protein n=1 Tax=Metabacillus litoralis TaxID=152268 RepID=A0A5C6VM00_9BACI|nr:hypothetical protein [Metabacillus litoralis]TXC86040.1 hypothetical protein FS935_18495 [Metabacillus litoralis]
MVKKNILNQNSIPFFILMIIHLGMIVNLMIKKKGKIYWFVLLSNIGFAYVFEFIVLNIFQAYKYKPAILKKSALDNIFGAILSQALFIPITATFLTATSVNWFGKLAFTIYFYLIEHLFIKLKVYKLYWWRPRYTFLLLPVAFTISDLMKSALEKNKKWAGNVVHYLSLVVVSITILFVPATMRKIRYGIGFYHSWKEHFILAPLYSFYISFVVFMNSEKSGMVQKFKTLLILCFTDYLLCYMKILKTNLQHILIRILFHSFIISFSNFIKGKIKRQTQNIH